MFRSILAVIAGYGVMAILVSLSTALAARYLLGATDLRSAMKLRPTPAYLAVNLAYSAAYAILAGFVTARLAVHDPLAHAIALGAVMLALAVVSRVQEADSRQPRFYGWMLIVLLPACAVAGGFLRSHP